MSAVAEELSGLSVKLDNLVYNHDPENLPEEQAHAFIYFLTISNLSKETVTLLGRKWIITYADQSTQVIEGDKIVGKTPTLEPGKSFSYNSYHVTNQNARVHGSFHGVTADGRHIFCKIPPFFLTISEDDEIN